MTRLEMAEQVELWVKFRNAIDTARKHVVLLMVAVGDENQHLAIVSAARIRSAHREADKLASELGTLAANDGNEAASMLMAARETAAPWLLRAPRTIALRDISEVMRQHARPRPTSVEPDELTNLDVDGIDLSRLDLGGAFLVHVRARRSRWFETTASYAELRYCSLAESTMSALRLDDADIIECSFDRSALDRSSWCRANVTNSSFAGCVFVDARLERATFSNCSFRGADFSVVNSTIPDGVVGTTFISCDMRESNWDLRSLAGTRFIDCKLYGVHGSALHIARVEVQNGDVSPQADGSEPLTPGRLRSLWPAFTP